MKKCSPVALVILGVVLPVGAWSQPPALLAIRGTHGTGNARSDSPYGVAVDASGNAYVVDALLRGIHLKTLVLEPAPPADPAAAGLEPEVDAAARPPTRVETVGIVARGGELPPDTQPGPVTR